MNDRLRHEISQINHDLRHIHLVRSTLNDREDRLLRRRMALENQRSDELEDDDDAAASDQSSALGG